MYTSQVVSHVYSWCVKVHVFTDGDASHPDLQALKRRFPGVTFQVPVTVAKDQQQPSLYLWYPHQRRSNANNRTAVTNSGPVATS